MRSNPYKTLLMVIVGVAGLAGLASAGSRVPDSDVPQIAVHYDASSLGTEHGVRALYKRLQSAAETVCPQSSSSTRWASGAVLRCRQSALAEAIGRVHNERLAALNAGRPKQG